MTTDTQFPPCYLSEIRTKVITFNQDISFNEMFVCKPLIVTNGKRYMGSAQTHYKSELSHDNVRNSVCSDWLSEASPEHNDLGGDNPLR